MVAVAAAVPAGAGVAPEKNGCGEGEVLAAALDCAGVEAAADCDEGEVSAVLLAHS